MKHEIFKSLDRLFVDMQKQLDAIKVNKITDPMIEIKKLCEEQRRLDIEV